MKILALEAATDACSVALLDDGRLLEHYELAPRQHAQRLLPLVQQTLAEAGLTLAQLDALAFGRGPGAFTGVRIATSVAQGLALASDRPLLPVSTLAALARVALDRGAECALAALDARMQEVYWALYRAAGVDGVQALTAEQVSAPQSVITPTGHWAAIGSGFASYAAQLPNPQQVWAQQHPSAGAIARLAAVDYQAGRAVAVAAALPVYVRDQVAQRPA